MERRWAYLYKTSDEEKMGIARCNSSSWGPTRAHGKSQKVEKRESSEPWKYVRDGSRHGITYFPFFESERYSIEIILAERSSVNTGTSRQAPNNK
jgi:hypothetical protein